MALPHCRLFACRLQPLERERAKCSEQPVVRNVRAVTSVDRNERAIDECAERIEHRPFVERTAGFLVRGQLDCQRDTVEPAADLEDYLDVVGGQFEGPIGRSRALGEQGQRAVALGVIQCR